MYLKIIMSKSLDCYNVIYDYFQSENNNSNDRVTFITHNKVTSHPFRVESRKL